ncbi:MAG: radical SAM protein [Candidatus Eisenbacteria bacterium]
MSDSSRLAILKTAPGAPAGAPDDTLVVHETYASLQGESTYAGIPCVFVRLSACHLRCVWCDTPHAFDQGARARVDDVVAGANAFGIALVEITGGEPLLQPGVYPVMAKLADLGHTVLLETSGSLDVSRVDPRVVKIMDLKCPDSGEEAHNRWENLDVLGPRDEIKFVLASRADYEWARAVIDEHRLAARWTVLLSVAHGLLSPADVAAWMVEDRSPARFQLQMHKVIWDPSARGV